jgi:hypothetical protein
MFSSLFFFGFGVLEMTNIPIKVSLQMHIRHLMNLNGTQYKFSKHHLFPFFVFNVIQIRQICLGPKLPMSKSSNMNKRKLLNKLQPTDFDEIIRNSQNINGNTNINKLLCHIRVSNKYVMASGSSCTTQRDKIFSMVNFMGTPSLFFTLNLAFVHHPFILFLIDNINLDLFYGNKMLDKNERCKQATMNPKAQAIFVHIFVNVNFKYMLQVKK